MTDLEHFHLQIRKGLQVGALRQNRGVNQEEESLRIQDEESGKEEGKGNFQDDVMGNPRKTAGKQVERTKSPDRSSRVERMSSRKWGN